MKTVNTDGENLHVFWKTWRISMKFSGKMWLMIILKVTKNQGFTPSREDTFLEKPQGLRVNCVSLSHDYFSKNKTTFCSISIEGRKLLTIFAKRVLLRCLTWFWIQLLVDMCWYVSDNNWMIMRGSGTPQSSNIVNFFCSSMVFI